MPEPKYTPLPESPGIKSRRGSFFSYSFYPVIILFPLLGFFIGRYSYQWAPAATRPQEGIELSSDIFFGDVRRRPVVLEKDQRFIDAEPRGRHPNGTLIPSIWDTIYTGTFIAVPNPESGGIGGKGQRMSHVAAYPDDFPPNSEAFGISAMHQLHCVMSLKQAIVSYGRGEVKGEGTGPGQLKTGHLHHCIEIIRQAIMCNADLSLEPLVDDESSQVSLGWGGVHMCRDWNEVHRAVMTMHIERNLTAGGWVDASIKL